MELGPILLVLVLVLVVGAVLAVAIPLSAARRPIHPGEAAFEAYAAEMESGPGWLPPPGWEAEQERINAAAAARVCTNCGFTAGEHVHSRCPGGDHDDWFTQTQFGLAR